MLRQQHVNHAAQPTHSLMGMERRLKLMSQFVTYQV